MRTIEYDCDFFTLPKTMGQKSGKSACCVLTRSIHGIERIMPNKAGKECLRHYKHASKTVGEKTKEDGQHIYQLGYCNTPCKDPESFWLYSFPVYKEKTLEFDTELIKQSCEEIRKMADNKKLETIYIPFLKDIQEIMKELMDDRFVMCIAPEEREEEP